MPNQLVDQMALKLNEDLIYSGSELRVDYRRWTATYEESVKPWKLISPNGVRSFKRYDGLARAIRETK